MARALAVALALLAVCAVVPAPASAHANHLTVDTQVVADDRVVVENAFVSVDAHVVIRADDDGAPGEPLGSTRVSPGMHTAVEVPLDEGTLDANRTLWAVLHRDDGDGEFSPDDDRALTYFGSVAGERFAARATDADSGANVVAEGFSLQRADRGSVSVERVELPRDGHLVVRDATGATENGSENASAANGTVVATRALDAGVHEDVPLDLSPANLTVDRGTADLVATVHVDDGDGTDGDGDRPVRVGDERVGSAFSVAVGETSGPESLGDPDLNTPTETPDEGERTSAPGTDADDGDGASDDTVGLGPGFGVFVALLALAVTGVLALSRRVR
ncbi:DUF7282 domain-containing protein [Halomarina ordinaria]|uniref:DUF7282 domain-containing protein n=1 Tax=Halomarina ordinaria TaxID=3033939 RepID=A0ABD5UFG1_9EURY|nr:hypothetical protein [Halomarina sp. PSRA2]